jgi:hypothetical protein
MRKLFGFERLQQLLTEFAAESRGLQLSHVPDLSFTDNMVEHAGSRDELVEFAKSLIRDGEYYRSLPDNFHDIINGLIGTAERLAEIVRELEPLFPCQKCGGRRHHHRARRRRPGRLRRWADGPASIDRQVSAHTPRPRDARLHGLDRYSVEPRTAFT